MVLQAAFPAAARRLQGKVPRLAAPLPQDCPAALLTRGKLRHHSFPHEAELRGFW
jgi:hypothetical protein